MTPEQERKLNEVYDFVKAMRAFNTIPLEVQMALSRKLKLGAIPRIETSAVNVSTFTQAVNEGGAGTYNVAKIMTDFISLVDGQGNIHTVATYD